MGGGRHYETGRKTRGLVIESYSEMYIVNLPTIYARGVTLGSQAEILGLTVL